MNIPQRPYLYTKSVVQPQPRVPEHFGSTEDHGMDSRCYSIIASARIEISPSATTNLSYRVLSIHHIL